MMHKNFIPELKQRGLIQDITPGLEEQLSKESTSIYIGFDPTAESLHIGSLIPIILLMHFQKNGHKPIALVGGATGMIGDPTGKSAERNLLNEESIKKYEKGIKNQLNRFLNFENGAKNEASLVNNYDWFKDFSFLNFIRDAGKHITVNYMLAKDSVQKRLGYGLSFTEFSYQVIQGYDFYYLNKNKNVKVQAGGADQWGNITTGVEMTRKMGGTEVFAFTCPLLTKSDGGKFGKTEGGNVWLDPNLTSPYSFYQFWLNSSDEDAKKYIKIFTFLDLDKIEELIQLHDEAPHLRKLQHTLANEVTRLVHSEEDLQFAIKASNILFGKATNEDLLSLSEKQILEVMSGVPQANFEKERLNEGLPLIDLLAEAQIQNSKGASRKIVQSGGIQINKVKQTDINRVITKADLLDEKYLIIQRGRRNYHLIIFE
ncbi:MAG TPA: tyrosine--tRNA ligase [Chitinophagaceae bacterium]|nr:tyrosine--tRNA ligase [Chitinophagaceae bacterium]